MRMSSRANASATMKAMPGIASAAVERGEKRPLHSRAMQRHFATMALTLAIVFASGCRRADSAGEGGGAALMRNLERSGRVDVIVDEAAAEEPLARAAARARRARPLDVVVRPMGTRATNGAARIVVGTRASEAARTYAGLLGVEIGGAGGPAWFRYGTMDFKDRLDALVATFEDPAQPGLPMTLVFANDLEVAVRTAGDLVPGWRPWIRLDRAGDAVAVGPIGANGAPWFSALARVGLARLATYKVLAPISGAPGVSVRAAKDLPASDVEHYVARCVAVRTHIASWAAENRRIAENSVTIWSRVEDYLASGRPDDLGRFDAVDGAVDVLLFDGVSDGGAAVARAAAYASLGEAAEPWMLDGAGLEAAWTWWGSDLDLWLADLARAKRALTIAAIVDVRSDARISSHVLRPMRAALWRFLRESQGDTFVRGVWRATRALEATPELESRFAAWLAARAAPLSGEVAARFAARHAAALSGSFLRGVGMEEARNDETFGVSMGYGTAACAASLDLALAHGADAVSITSFALADSGSPPLATALDAFALGPREGEVRLFAAMRQARSKGLRVLVSPQLLTGTGGSWSGAYSRRDAADWADFYERYARFVEDYAWLAELGGAQMLSIGSGLDPVSGAASEGRRAVLAEIEWKRAGWARVIATARASFAGLLTLSAGSPQEASKVGFWSDLDAIGYELMPTLEFEPSKDGRDARAEIESVITRELSVLERLANIAQKPIVLTQIGFSPDLHGAAAALGSGDASVAWHARQYAVLGELLGRSSVRAKMIGAFAWRWSTDPADRGSGAHDVILSEPAVRNAVRQLLSR
jgi:hypothetical protein